MKKILIAASMMIILAGCSFFQIAPVEFTYNLVNGTDTVEINSTWVDAGVHMYIDDIELVATPSGTVDITKLGLYKVEYTIEYEDTAYYVYRYVRVVDQTPPVITLNPGIDTVRVGTEWEDAGATAIDNSHESITVVTTGTVNPNVAGRYTITYTAIDSSGNQTTRVRIVNVGDSSNTLMSIEDVINSADGTPVHVRGIVTGIVTYGFMVYDSGHYIFVYDFNHFDEIKVGADIEIEGTRGTYNYTDQIIDITYTIHSYNNNLPNPQSVDIGGFVDNLIEYGATVTITGTLVYDAEEDRYKMYEADDDYVYIYFRSHEEELEPYIGDNITINVILVYYCSVAFNGYSEDVIVNE